MRRAVDALGNPTRIVLTPGQTHETRVAEELLGDIHHAYVIGDSAKALVDALVARGSMVVIPANPTHPQRDYDAVQAYRHALREARSELAFSLAPLHAPSAATCSSAVSRHQ